MRNTALKKNIFREIRGSFGRFLAIFLISALGVGFFAGLRICNKAMRQTANTYIEKNALYDFRLISTLGFETGAEVIFLALPGIGASEAAVYQDAVAEIDGKEQEIYRIHSITESVNRIEVTEGRMPEKAGEIALDSRFATSDCIGKTMQIISTDGDSIFCTEKFTVTGLVKTPYYLNYERGSTSLGTGSLSAFAYTPRDSFCCEYNTEIFITLSQTAAIYSDAYGEMISEATHRVEALTSTLATARYEKIRSEAEEEIRSAEEKVNDGREKLRKAEKDISDGEKKLEEGRKNAVETFEKTEQELADGEKSLQAAEQELSVNRQSVCEQINALTDMGMEIPEALSSAQKQLDEAALTLTEQRAALSDGRTRLENAKKEAEETFARTEQELLEGKAELEEKKAELEDGEKELSEAKEKLSELEEPDCYILTREENVGYVCFENDAAIVDGIAKVFPVFFFLVAALICMTTMTRMCEEQRGQIGILRALGYSRRQILRKFLTYSGLAALTGCVIGFFIGTYAFPRVIWMTYDIMYGFSDIEYVLDIPLGLLSLGAGLICSLGVTGLCCVKICTVAPAELMRPKAPKAGKRILLEYIPFLWKPMKFLHKVTARNLFRYKGRFVMMVLGIGGCTALLVTGFGISDSIANVVMYQYDEISLYDYSMVIEPRERTDCEELCEKIADLSAEAVLLREINMDVEAGDKTKAANVVLSSDPSLYSYVDLHDASGKIDPPQTGEAVINIGLAQALGLSVGEKLTLRDANRNSLTLTLSGICENYIYNYVYVTPEDYAAAFEAPLVNTVYLKGEAGLAAKLSELPAVNSVTEISAVRKRFTDMLGSMDYIVLAVIVCAAALAFVVLYNLTNININERIREIATLKVLGFYRRETAGYVYRENTVLTLLGAGAGLFMGKALHAYVMAQIHIDLMYFDVRITSKSYLLAFALTLLFSMAVNLVMLRRIAQINMTESLKSVE